MARAASPRAVIGSRFHADCHSGCTSSSREFVTIRIACDASGRASLAHSGSGAVVYWPSDRLGAARIRRSSSAQMWNAPAAISAARPPKSTVMASSAGAPSVEQLVCPALARSGATQLLRNHASEAAPAVLVTIHNPDLLNVRRDEPTMKRACFERWIQAALTGPGF